MRRLWVVTAIISFSCSTGNFSANKDENTNLNNNNNISNNNNTTEDCPDGEVFIVDTCYKICKDESDCDSDLVCENRICVPVSSCGQNDTNKACDDNNACTENDVCQSNGSCTGTSVDCSNQIVNATCQQAQCVEPTGCQIETINVGSACDDANDCTKNDICQSDGTCKGNLGECPVVENADYFVDNTPGQDCSGNYDIDNRTCSNSSTGRTSFDTLAEAISNVNAGDLILIRSGTYYPTKQTIFRGTGTVNEPIVIQSFPGEVPIIDGRDVPEGDITHASTPTWVLDNAQFWQIIGPMHITNGRGAGIAISGVVNDIVFDQIESSYNGKRAARGAHGFAIGGVSWTTAARIQFVNCDAHHNANHLTKPGEEVTVNQWQHGDGWRIMSGVDIQLIGCRAWYNMDDNYDFTQAPDAILVIDSWAAYAGHDDLDGSITGDPNSFSEDGQGFKIGYNEDIAEHKLVRTMAWENKESGYFARGGKYTLYNAISYKNGIWGDGPVPRLGFYFPPDSFNRQHEIRNSWAFADGAETISSSQMTSTNNSWDSNSTFTVAADDFLSLDDAEALGPREADGSLPNTDFLKLKVGSDLIDAGIDVGEPYNGSAPDIGAFESN